MDLEGMRCGPDECEPARKSRIQIVRWSRRSVLGNFEVEFKDGSTLKGSFRMKNIKPSTEIICE